MRDGNKGKFSARVIDIINDSAARKELEVIGVNPLGVKVMSKKGVFRAVKVEGVKSTAANIIKQEMLARGGEVAVSHGTIDHSVSVGDILIFGTVRQIEDLLKKLELHQFDLPVIAKSIKGALASYDGHPAPIKAGRLTMDFGRRTYIMGILNVTPDSFSDSGRFFDPDDAVEHALRMEGEGADIIDIGGESSRPGAKGVTAKKELKRVLPVIKKLKGRIKAPISIDTTKSEVARAALEAGASMINDISGLRFDPGIARVAARHRVPVVIMHIKGRPRTMQRAPRYSDLVQEILDYFAGSIRIAESAGVPSEKIILDPGIGFGKTLENNFEILRRLAEFRSLGRPILVGVSRKSMIGKTLGLPEGERLEGTAAAVAASIANGADIVRVHDVAAMKRVSKMTDALVRI